MNKMYEGALTPSFLVENEARKKKWEHLTEGLDDHKRLVLETLLENAERWAMNEASDTSNVQAFTTFGFPLIRRVFPNLIANELVSVQPMSMPTAMVFYLDFAYGTTIRGTTAGDVIAGNGMANFNPYYAGGVVRGLVLGEGDNTTVEFVVNDSHLLPVLANSAMVYVDGVAVDFTLTDAATGTFTLEEAPAEGAVVTVDYSLTTPTEGGDNIPEIDFNMTSDSVVAETKKLKAKWTLEAQQDMLAYHGVNAETEMLAILGDEIRREIDRQIVNDLYNIASAGNVNWSATAPVDYNGSDREYKMTLWEAIIDANNLIYKRRFRNATWIVADPDTCASLEKLDGFSEVPRDWAGQAGMGLERFGVIRNRFTVYKDPMAPTGKILLGHKGTSMFETGYVYAPYVPLYTSPVFTDPNTMQSVRSVMSRYARKPLITDLYATVTIS
jgi:hypothetical protein